MDQSGTYDFLLLNHGNYCYVVSDGKYRQINHHFRDKWQFRLIIQVFPTPCI